MGKIILNFVICFVGCFSVALAEGETISDENAGASSVDYTPITLEPRAEPPIPVHKKIWRFVKGRPADNAVLLGLFSLHTEPGSFDEDRWHHELVGVQYRGYSISTFTNSHNDQMFAANISRTVYEKKLPSLPIRNVGWRNLSFQAGYRAGIMYGYKEKVPEIGGFTPFVLPYFSLVNDYVGIDMIFIPSAPDFYPLFIIGTRIQLDPILDRLGIKAHKVPPPPTYKYSQY